MAEKDEAVPTDKSANKPEDAAREGEDNDAREEDNDDPLPGWLPPERVDYKQFEAYMTCVDNDGFIYLYDFDQQVTRNLIRNTLYAKYKLDFRPGEPNPEAMTATWEVGEPCIVLRGACLTFRGVVRKVYQQKLTCLVYYIDYGNEVVVSFGSLRKGADLCHIPIQILKCALNRIHPIGNQWSQDTIQFLRISLVEKSAVVKVVGEAVDGVVPIELKYCGMCVNDVLVDFERAEYEDGIVRYCSAEEIKELLEEDTLDSDEPSSSAASSKEDQQPASNVELVTYPKYSGNEYPCFMSEINGVRKFPVQIFYEDKELDSQYRAMHDELQSEGMNMPPLKEIFEDKPCIVLSADNCEWYRASIILFSKRECLVQVKYADHSDVEFIPLENTREISTKWLKLPPANLYVKIFGLRMNRKADMNIIRRRYFEAFFQQGPFMLSIKGYEGVTPLVEIRDEDNDLAYENFIENDMLIKN
ncbi:tudor domain-containing protein 1-like [Spodoptera litura]|uniref:Tudor domain-containing protein 1-like n=1 Tax=Spodoptera litura TaxID=69820 RepID=A0A9J7J1C1_SPOLT|nr:tudor domain-containing protein 1-like [Spodoptera litura]